MQNLFFRIVISQLNDHPGLTDRVGVNMAVRENTVTAFDHTERAFVNEAV